MNEEFEAQLTIKFVAVALVTALAAFLLTPSYTASLDVTDDVGKLFYPKLKDFDQVEGLEVFSYDEDLGTVKTFKVQYKDGRWCIPSHSDYPADAVEQMAKVSASLFDLKKNQFVSEQVKDHEKFKVLDPADDKNANTITGMGTRVNLLDNKGAAIASYIFGDDVPNRNGFRYVRLPKEKRTYATVIQNIDLSTSFSDWIEKDLLKISSGDIVEINILNYEIDIQRRQKTQLKQYDLKKKDGQWTMVGLRPDEQLTDKVKELESTLESFLITGVRPKPEGLKKLLSGKGDTLDESDQMSLASKGFYLVRSGGIQSNVGEVHVVTKKGVRYLLWFGELAYGTTNEVSATGGDLKKGAKKKGPADNRYLMVHTAQAMEMLVKPARPNITGLAKEAAKKVQDKYDKDLSEFTARKKESDEVVSESQSRFAAWYYLIAEEKFRTLRLDRKGLVEKKKAKKEEDHHKGHDHNDENPLPEKDNKPEKKTAPEAPKKKTAPEAPKKKTAPEAPKKKTAPEAPKKTP
jgi:hypothetical protein